MTSRRVFSSVLCIPRPTLCCVAMERDYVPWGHWRQPRRGCRGHIPPNFGWGTSTGISPPILLRTFGHSRPILVALRSLSLKPIPFGYKTPPIRFSQAGGQSTHKARPHQPWTRVDATAWGTSCASCCGNAYAAPMLGCTVAQSCIVTDA